MPAAAFGAKFTCFSCQAKFYDLGRPEAICPKCKANQKDAPKPKAASRSRSSEKAKAAKKPVVVEPDPEELVEAEEGSLGGVDRVAAAEVEEEDDEA